MKIDEIIKKFPDDQRTQDWEKKRLGMFTGSAMGKYMASSKTKGETFGATAKDALYKLAGERMLSQLTLTDEVAWDEYKHQTSIWSKAIQFGVDHEEIARSTYEFQSGLQVKTCGSVVSETIDNLSASPDGLAMDGDRMICWECKCPMPHTAVKYMAEIKDAETLKKANSDYYWQVMTEMLVTGADAADFSVYCPFLEVPMKTVRIERDEEACKTIEERVKAGNEFVDAIIESIRN